MGQQEQLQGFHRQCVGQLDDEPGICSGGTSLKLQDALSRTETDFSGELMVGQPLVRPSPSQSLTIEARVHGLNGSDGDRRPVEVHPGRAMLSRACLARPVATAGDCCLGCGTQTSGAAASDRPVAAKRGLRR